MFQKVIEANQYQINNGLTADRFGLITNPLCQISAHNDVFAFAINAFCYMFEFGYLVGFVCVRIYLIGL